MGRSVFLEGHKLGMTQDAQNTVEDIGILFKGPMETPKGGGNRSINVTARKLWSTFANCRRFKYLPGVETIFSKSNIFVDLTIIRENLEDTYGGVEHLSTSDLELHYGVGGHFLEGRTVSRTHKKCFLLYCNKLPPHHNVHSSQSVSGEVYTSKIVRISDI